MALQAVDGGSIRPRRVPKGEHSIETEAIDRLSNTDLLDMPCDRAQAERIQHDGGRGPQERQVAESGS